MASAQRPPNEKLCCANISYLNIVKVLMRDFSSYFLDFIDPLDLWSGFAVEL